MRPIVLFVFAAIAASAVGAATLSNTIELNVQQFGVGSEIIESPIDAASVDFEIRAVKADGQLKNLITHCSFHSAEDLPAGSSIICKLTGEPTGTVIAEGTFALPEGYVASDRELIEITVFAFPNANLVNNVHDVTLVVVGSNPTIVP
jgi:hypothetical protein